MKKWILVATTLVLALQFQANKALAYEGLEAQEQVTVDDVMTPDELLQEVLDSGNPDLELNLAPEAMMFNSRPARLVIEVNKAASGPGAQTMWVTLDGRLIHTFRVSTGREKLETAKSGRTYRTSTPVGQWRPYMMTRNHFSKTWQANMPNAIFFTGGIAIHAANPGYEKYLGQRNSGGCVRLSLQNSAIVYELVRSVGMSQTLIRVFNR